ncbi:unnamed protein product, partial [Timema podura]|nr:unnamed protein product [Timema podura]
MVCCILQGKLPGYGVEEKLPTIALVAHYDSFGVAPTHTMYLCEGAGNGRRLQWVWSGDVDGTGSTVFPALLQFQDSR